MRIFFVGCIAGVVIAIGAYAVLSGVQKPVDLAYKTEAVRI